MEIVARTIGNAAGLWLATRLLSGLSVPEGAGAGPMWLNLLVLGLVRFGAAFVRRYSAGRLALDVQHDLRRAVEASVGELPLGRQHITIESFGFKHGSPRDADIVLDVRFLPNPYWVEELREFRGVDKAVADYVLSQEGARDYVDNVVELLSSTLGGYRHEGKDFITVGVGCTGGHHRSVAVAEAIGKRLSQQGQVDVNVIHRDLERH